MKKEIQKIMISLMVIIQIAFVLPQGTMAATTIQNPTPIEGTEILLAADATWHYLDDGSDGGTSWMKEDFDSSLWKSGQAELGYGDGVEKTTVSYGGNSSNKYITTYFRTTFEVADQSKYKDLVLRLVRDDGAVVYLNGQEVVRSNMPDGTITYTTFANGTVDSANEYAFNTYSVANSLLKNGTNTVAVEIHQDRVSSSDISFMLEVAATINTVPETPVETLYLAKDIALTPGKNSSELNLAWYSTTEYMSSGIQVAKKSDMTGDVFPVASAVAFGGTISDAVTGYKSNKVTITGLESETEYIYRVGDGTVWSKIYSFKTQSTDGYNVLLVGDPQIGAGGVTSDTAGWSNTVNKALTAFPETSFILSAGDQVETASNESHYDGFLTPAELTGMPIAPTVGNHDNGVNYTYHYNTPNLSSSYGTTAAGGDYYFVYGNTLYMVLNTNNSGAATHKSFMQEAIAANPDVTWKVVMFHQAIYSSASHSTSSSIKNLRAALFPVFDELKIDLVVSGHDHCYTRSYHMIGDVAQKDQTLDNNGNVVNAKGTLYITANSASGSKYYAMQGTPEPYAAVRQQLNTPTFSNISIQGDTLTISTYRVDTMEQVDTYTMTKGEEVVEPIHTLTSVSLLADGSVLTTGDSSIYGPIQLALEGKNELGNTMSLAGANITYHMDPAGTLTISDDYKVTVAGKPEPNTEVKLWATVTLGDVQMDTNKVSISVKDIVESTMITGDSMWKYKDDGSNQGTSWSQSAFDDSQWKSGKGALGYPVGDNNSNFGTIGQGTLVNSKSNPNALITYYFRQEFEVKDLENIEKLYGIMGFDDGYVMYINGTEVRRKYMPEGEVNYLTAATYVNEPSTAEGTDQADLTDAILPLLQEGKNIIAVEVHNRDNKSSDIYWAMKLIAFESKGAPVQAPTVKIYSEQDVWVSDQSNQVEFKYAVSQTNGLNAIDVTFRYDSQLLVYKNAELTIAEDAVIQTSMGQDSVRIIVGFTKPVTSEAYQDVFKLVFERMNQWNGDTEVAIVNSITTNSGVNEEIASVMETSKAKVLLTSNKILCDVNRDGFNTISDLSIALDYFKASNLDPNWNERKVADVNMDGVVDVADYTLIILNIF